MKILFKINDALLEHIREDLLRTHPFASERVGFLFCKPACFKADALVILAQSFLPIEDTDYVDDRSVGALMGSVAIRKALQLTYNHPVSAFHIHMHDHRGIPRPSRTDLKETSKFIPDFWHVRPRMPHGAVILSLDSLSGRCWYPGEPEPIGISEFVIVGSPLRFVR